MSPPIPPTAAETPASPPQAPPLASQKPPPPVNSTSEDKRGLVSESKSETTPRGVRIAPGSRAVLIAMVSFWPSIRLPPGGPRRHLPGRPCQAPPCPLIEPTLGPEPMSQEGPETRWLTGWFAVLTGLAWLLVIVGALVRAHGAGLACPDWPL